MLLKDKIQLIDLEELHDIFIDGGWFKFSVQSDSMFPTLAPGDRVEIVSITNRHVELGDIVVFKKIGRLFVHRVINVYTKNGQEFILTKGDRATSSDEPILVEDIVGKVVAIKPRNWLESLWYNHLCFKICAKLMRILSYLQGYSLYGILVRWLFPTRVTYWVGVTQNTGILQRLFKYLRYSPELKTQFTGAKEYRILAKVCSKVVGSLGVRWMEEEGYWEIYNLYLFTLLRRKRIATKLVTIMLNIIDIANNNEISVSMPQENVIAKAFFKKMGFDAVSNNDNGYLELRLRIDTSKVSKPLSGGARDIVQHQSFDFSRD